MIRAPKPIRAKTLCHRCGCAFFAYKGMWVGTGVGAYRLCLDCVGGPGGQALV